MCQKVYHLFLGLDMKKCVKFARREPVLVCFATLAAHQVSHNQASKSLGWTTTNKTMKFMLSVPTKAGTF